MGSQKELDIEEDRNQDGLANVKDLRKNRISIRCLDNRDDCAKSIEQGLIHACVVPIMNE